MWNNSIFSVLFALRIVHSTRHANNSTNTIIIVRLATLPSAYAIDTPSFVVQIVYIPISNVFVGLINIKLFYLTVCSSGFGYLIVIYFCLG